MWERVWAVVAGVKAGLSWNVRRAMLDVGVGRSDEELADLRE
jgi:hypothetical protein